MNANSNINTGCIRVFVEEVASTQDVEENETDLGNSDSEDVISDTNFISDVESEASTQDVGENETDLGNSDLEDFISDTNFTSDVESEEERNNLEHSTETARKQKETYIPTELKKGIFKILITLRDWTYLK